MKRKFLSGAVQGGETLGPRQIRVVASTAALDRVGDILDPKGCVAENYLKNPIVLASHDPKQPIGKATLEISDAAVSALIEFAPEGVSEKADEFCGLAKSGILNAVSVGFEPIDVAPLKDGGAHFKKWELLEISIVAVPCNPQAAVAQRDLTGAAAHKDARKIVIKDLNGVADLAWLLNYLGYLQASAAWESEAEGDGSKIPQMLADCMRNLGDALAAMTAEEIAELLADANARLEKSKQAPNLKSFLAQRMKALPRHKSGRAISEKTRAALSEACKDILGGHDAIKALLDSDASDEAQKDEDFNDDEDGEDDCGEKSATPILKRSERRLAYLKRAANE